MTSTSAPRRSARGPAAETFLPDVIWEEIFLRLDGAADLARASAACTAFRRVVSEPRFAARFRSLRSPAVLGFISRERHQFVPAEPPHRSAPEGRALGLAADFTFSFLPDPSAWDFRHARDGRVLLSRVLGRVVDFVVCDPLYRRYVTIPRIPLLPEFRSALPNVDFYDTPHYGPVLAPAGENEDELSFRVIRTVQTRLGQVMAFVFSSCNQEWTCINSTRRMPKRFIEYVPYYAHDCIYWVDYSTGLSLMLDTSEMKLSTIGLPLRNCDSMRAIVEAEEGRHGFVIIRDGTVDLYCKNRQSNCVGANEWQHNKRIPLPTDSGNYRWEIEGATGRYVALVAHQIIGDESLPMSEHFVLDIKTLLVEKLCTSNNNGMFYGFPYARFPPLLALPSI